MFPPRTFSHDPEPPIVFMKIPPILRFIPLFILVSRFPAIAESKLETTTTATANGVTITAKVDQAAKKVRVEIGGSLFTELVYSGHPKPVLFPVIGPGGMMMVRQWPMSEAAAGEEKDHPHHKGLWFTHGNVNGVDFWAEKPEAGKIVVQGVPEVSSKDGAVVLKTSESWQKPDGSVVVGSTTSITCGVDGEDRFIDYTITLSTDAGEVVFGDTKEGTMGIRTNPLLNLKGAGAKGTATSSEGKTGASIWGTSAKWLDYTAPAGEGAIGVACFDHPSNLRHPTTWHARDYGLIAANPFGLHDFQKKPVGAGDYVLKKDQPLKLQYRWLFHRGGTAEARIAQRWEKWAAVK